MWTCVALLVLAICGAQGKAGFGEGGQEYGYVDVRPGAHMFYWLFYVNGGEVAADKPLVIWLQGGPGASSTSFGNFEEIGPLDSNLNKRNSSWVKYVNLLFIDNPVGTGFSYVDHFSQLTTDNQQIAADLVEFTRSFMIMYPQFQKLPLYIFCESYGGKMTAEFALELYKAQKAGTVLSKLKGVALIDSWISPLDSVMSWAQYLLQTGMVDTRGYEVFTEAAQRVKDAVDAEEWYKAFEKCGWYETVIASELYDIDFYNILTRIPYDDYDRKRNGSVKPSEIAFRNHVMRSASDAELEFLMNTQVKPVLGVIPPQVEHVVSSQPVYDTLAMDFMKPVTDIIEQLLNDTDVTIAVISGQLDLIVDTPGTLAWVERLKWNLADFWLKQVPREPLVVDGIIEGFHKTTSEFTFYWISRSGHMVPADNPAVGVEVLKRVTNLKD